MRERGREVEWTDWLTGWFSDWPTKLTGKGKLAGAVSEGVPGSGSGSGSGRSDGVMVVSGLDHRLSFILVRPRPREWPSAGPRPRPDHINPTLPAGARHSPRLICIINH